MPFLVHRRLAEGDDAIVDRNLAARRDDDLLANVEQQMRNGLWFSSPLDRGELAGLCLVLALTQSVNIIAAMPFTDHRDVETLLAQISGEFDAEWFSDILALMSEWRSYLIGRTK